MKLVFLDVDGILNHEDHYHSLQFESYKDAKKQLRKDVKAERIERLDYYKSQISAESMKWLNYICDHTDAVVVVSSTWRMNKTVEQLQEVFDYCGATFKVLDKTPVLHFSDGGDSVPRGCEIERWLEDHEFRQINWSVEKQKEYIEKSGIENFIILDDDADMLYGQRNHFVHIPPAPRHRSGLNERFAIESVEKLRKSYLELNGF